MPPAQLDAYARFVAEQKLPLWWQPDWLEAASVESDGDWDVALLEEDGELIAVWPYATYRKGPFTVLTNPPLTPRLGIAQTPIDGHASSQLIERRRRLGLLLEQLPKHSHLRQNFLPSYGSWQPLRWAGFAQTSRTTFVLDTADLRTVYDGLHGSLRRHLRAAENELQVFEHGGLVALYQLQQASFARQKLGIPYSLDLLMALDGVAEAHGRRKLLFAADKQGQVIAGLYLIADAQAVTYLASGLDPARKDSSAMPMLVWRGIEWAHELGLPFDFEGSDLEGVAEFFARFGGRAVSYHELWKTPSTAYRWLQTFKHG